MHYRVIVSAQRRWLAELQAISPKPILIQRHKTNRWHDWFTDIPATPYHTRSILQNELVFDPDTPDWKAMREGMNRIASFLRGEGIPFVLAYTGGKGCHLHVFFDSNIPLPEDMAEELSKHNIDVARIARNALYDYILQGAGVQEQKIKLDRAKINWSSRTKGSMVRIIGSMREGGQYKTMVEEIPHERPAEPLPLRFPARARLWKPNNKATEALYSALREQIRLSEQLQVRARIEMWAHPEGRNPAYVHKCHALQTAEQGVHEGQRDLVATGLICAFRKWYRLPLQRAMATIRQWCYRCTPPFDTRTAEYKVKRIYSLPDNDVYKPCFFMRNAGLCDRC